MFRSVVAGLRSVKMLWGWLTPRWRAFLVCAVVAAPITLFYGVQSSRAIADYIADRVFAWPYWAIDWLSNAVALFLVVLLLMLRKKAAVSASEPTGKADGYRLLDDVALHGDLPDELGLERFVSRLSRTVVLPPRANSLVVGLEGPWGSGKSSVLELLVRRMNDHEDEPVVVRFHPWLASGTDGVSRAFFSQLSGSLIKSDERKLANRLVRFGEILEELMPPPARILPRLGMNQLRRISGRIPEVDIRGEWERLSAGVAEINRPIVVVIDDIDRLEASEVATIFQLVKAVASFPRVAYILAFDPKPVDAALTQGGMHESGREYRDKIIQANIHLPRIPYQSRKDFFQRRIDQRIESWNFEITDSERRALAEAIPLALTVLKTPRDMKRVLNKMMMTADGLRREVNIADVLIFEATSLVFPNVIDLIRSRPQVMNAGDHEGEVGYEESMGEILAQRLDKKKWTSEDRLADFTRMYEGHEADLRPLLTFMFRPIFYSDAARPPASHLRVSDPSTLRKLLYQEVRGELSASAAFQFLTVPDTRKALLAEAVDTNSLPAFFSHLTPHVETVAVFETLELLCLTGESVNEQFRRWGSDSSDDARHLVLAIIAGIKDEVKRRQVFDSFVTHPDFIATTEPVLVRLLRDVGLWEGGKYLGLQRSNQNARRDFPWLEASHLDRTRGQWVSVACSHSVADILTRFPNAGGILFRILQLADRSVGDLQVEIERALQDDSVATNFINLFPPGIGLDGVEELLSQEAQSRLIQCANANARINERTAERFIEYIEHRRDLRVKTD